MALPGNTVSLDPVITPLVPPDSLPYDPYIVWERGGFDVQEVGNAGFVYKWKGEYKDGKVTISSDNGHSHVVLENLADVISIDMSFDQNMNYAIAYDTPTGAYLYWYDSLVGHYVTTFFAGGRTPRVSLDDKRTAFQSSSDIIFAYITSGGNLVYRQQRDRYTIQRTLRTGIPNEVILQKIGMSAGNRLVFELSPQYLLPVCPI